MLLQIKNSGELVKIMEIQELLDPNSDIVHGREQEGEEEQPPDTFKKKILFFLLVKFYHAVG